MQRLRDVLWLSQASMISRPGQPWAYGLTSDPKAADTQVRCQPKRACRSSSPSDAQILAAHPRRLLG